MAFKNNLPKLREAAGFRNAKEFAKEIGIPYSTYMGYENKNAWPTEENLKKIAQALHVSIDMLLDYSVDERPALERAKAISKMMGVKFQTGTCGDQKTVYIYGVRHSKTSYMIPLKWFVTLVYAAYNKANSDMEQWTQAKFCENLQIMIDNLVFSRLKASDLNKLELDLDNFPYRDESTIPDADVYTDWLIDLASKQTATLFVGDVNKSELLKALKGDTGHEGGKA